MKTNNTSLTALSKGLFIATITLLLFSSRSASAQSLALSTNFADWADLGTINADMSYSLARHWSIGAGVQYNPFSFTTPSGRVIRDREQSYAVGTRYWPWHVYSGWFLGSKFQYQEFNTVSSSSQTSAEGDRVGTGISAGYAKMLGSHLNMELGLGAWLGMESYKTYSCPTCGVVSNYGDRSFILPDQVIMSLAYIF